MPAVPGGQKSRNDRLLPTWARVPPGMAWKRPGLPTEWTRVLERNPEAILNPEPLPGYVWLDTPGKVLHVEAARLEGGCSGTDCPEPVDPRC